MWMTILLYILVLIEYGLFCYIFFKKKPKRIILKMYIGSIVILCGIIFAVINKCNSGMKMGLVYILAFVMFFSLFDLSLSEAVKITVISFLILSIIEVLVLFSIIVIWDFGDVINNILYTAVTIVIICIYHMVVKRKVIYNIFNISDKAKKVIIAAIAMILFMVSFFISNLLDLEGKSGIIGITVITGGVLGIFVLLLVIIYYINKMQRQFIINDMLDKYNKQQEEYYQNMLKRENDTRQFRHDIINHLLELQSLNKNGAYNQADEYIRNMLKDISNISNSQYDVGNIIMNTMLNHYFIPVRDKCNIVVDGYISDNLSIDNTDICTVVSNLIKNSVEAVSKASDNNKEILFLVSQGDKYLKIYIENTIDSKIVFDKNNIPVTTKPDSENHGFGILNVKKVVKKYDGIYDAKADNGKYMVNIALKCEKEAVRREI